jgi:hemerythrin-like domain-containing protein
MNVSEATFRVATEQSTFLSLLEIHERLDELFASHQEALLALDVELAQASLKQFELDLRAHMRIEEDLLLPIYARAGRIKGGPPEFYTGEHKKMLEFLARFNKQLEALGEAPADLKRGIIDLFDQEAVFKQLMQHHDMREQNLLYPTLDKVTSEAEREALLAQCRTTASADPQR